MKAAAKFIVRRQARDGTWRDFLTLAGEAEDWTTAYVGSQLGAASVTGPSLRRATGAILRRQRPDGGWGYNARVPTDGDSTAWALLFLSRRTRRRSALAAGVRRLLEHQDPRTGGIATYSDPDPIRRYMRLPPSASLAGWCQSHVEVTALAGRALAATRESPSAAITAAWRFVRQHQGDDGQWHSYWWTTPLYATLQAVAFACSRPGLPGARGAVRRAVRWVIDAQRADGGWAQRSAATASVFETALGVTILSCGQHADGCRDALERGLARLNRLRLATGAWPSAPMLRIPPPGVTKPERYRGWCIDELGTGVVIPDQHALFTTATALRALVSGWRQRVR